MYIRSLTLFISFLLFLFTKEIKAQAPAVAICNYLNNKKAAVSITFDDGCRDQFLIGQPIMDNLGFEGTFFIITNYTPGTGFDYGCSYNLTWGNLQNAINHGHEIASHTVHHSLLDSLYSKYGADTVESELRKSKDTLNKHLSGQKVFTFAYPEGSGGDDTPVSDQVRKLVHKYYIGARAAGAGPKGYDTYPYAIGGGFNDFYYQIESLPIYDTTSLNNYTYKLDGAIRDGGWFLPMYHNFNQNDELSVTTAAFTDQMNAINDRKSSLWIAPFKDVLKYHKEKTAAAVSMTVSPAQLVVALTDTITNPDFDMPLTLLVTNLSSNCRIDSIKQGTRKIQFRIVGNSLQFNALPDQGDITIYKSTINYTVPVLTSLAPSSITASSASSGGNVTNDGNTMVTAKGVCWSTSSAPTISDSKTFDGTDEGSFTSSLTNLNPNTTYYLRAYATNSIGTAYGNELSFTTLAIITTVPVVSTNVLSSITSSSASSGGKVTNDGNATVTAKGVCWSTGAGPTISGNKTVDGTGEGIFTSSITDLNPGTIYYLRAYATNSVGTGYGNELSFTTSSPTSIAGNSLLNTISVYPNPSPGLFRLSVQSYQSPLSELKIFNAEGRVVYKEDLNGFIGDYFKDIDMKGLLSGIYCVEITTGKNRIIRKVVVQF